MTITEMLCLLQDKGPRDASRPDLYVPIISDAKVYLTIDTEDLGPIVAELTSIELIKTTVLGKSEEIVIRMVGVQEAGE